MRIYLSKSIHICGVPVKRIVFFPAKLVSEGEIIFFHP